MTLVLAVGPDSALLEGVSQTLTAAGHRVVIASGISDGSSHADGNDFRAAKSGAGVAYWADPRQRVGNEERV